MTDNYLNEPDDFKTDFERQKRFRIVALAIPLFFAILLLIVGSTRILDLLLPYGGGIRVANGLYIDLSATLLFMGIIIISLMCIVIGLNYLQTGFSELSNSSYKRNGIDISTFPPRMMTKMAFGEYIPRSSDYIAIYSDIEEIREKLRHLNESVTGKTTDQIDAITDQLVERVLDTGGEELVARASSKLQSNVARFSSLTFITETFDQSFGRISQEILRLDRKSNLNLLFGGVSTFIGIFWLGFSVVFDRQNFSSFELFAMSFAPKLSIVIILQFFSLFFLKLYKSNLGEIKYYQNEMTNLEMKQIAVISAQNNANEFDLKEILTLLAKTERNQILEKGQSTIEIEQAKLEMKNDSDLILSKLSKLINRS